MHDLSVAYIDGHMSRVADDISGWANVYIFKARIPKIGISRNDMIFFKKFYFA